MMKSVQDLVLDFFLAKPMIDELKSTYSRCAEHDSLPIGRVIDTGMIFVPSKDGRSHCKDEFTDYEYLMQAVIVATDVICNID